MGHLEMAEQVAQALDCNTWESVGEMLFAYASTFLVGWGWGRSILASEMSGTCICVTKFVMIAAPFSRNPLRQRGAITFAHNFQKKSFAGSFHLRAEMYIICAQF